MTRKSGQSHKGWKSAVKEQHKRPGAYLADGTRIKPPAILHPFYGQPEDDEGCSVSRPTREAPHE